MTQYKPVSNDAGLSVQILLDHELTPADQEKCTPFMGGMDTNPSWKEYVDLFMDEYHDHIRLIRKCIEENYLVGSTGQDADEFNFKFSDGNLWSYSWRAWGDLMQAIVDKKEGYMAYYM